MLKTILVAFASAVLLVLAGCATQPQQVACKLSPTKTVYTDSEGDCAGLLQALRPQQVPMPDIRLQQNAPTTGPLVFSNEGTGAGICRLISVGGIRLKADPSRVYSRGAVLATEKATSESGSATVFARRSGEDCNAWRRRAGEDLVFKG